MATWKQLLVQHLRVLSLSVNCRVLSPHWTVGRVPPVQPAPALPRSSDFLGKMTLRFPREKCFLRTMDEENSKE